MNQDGTERSLQLENDCGDSMGNSYLDEAISGGGR
jgi:hypothetical protein